MAWKKLPDYTIQRNPERYLGRRVKHNGASGERIGVLIRDPNNPGKLAIQSDRGEIWDNYGGTTNWYVRQSYLSFLVERERQLLAEGV